MTAFNIGFIIIGISILMQKATMMILRKSKRSGKKLNNTIQINLEKILTNMNGNQFLGFLY